MEDYTYHLAPGSEKILGAHMLEVCPSHRRRAARRCEIHPLGIGGREDPVRLVFDARPGPAVVVGLTDLGDRFRLVANEIDVVAPDEPLPDLPVARAVWKPAPGPAHVGRGLAHRRRAAPHGADPGGGHRDPVATWRRCWQPSSLLIDAVDHDVRVHRPAPLERGLLPAGCRPPRGPLTTNGTTPDGETDTRARRSPRSPRSPRPPTNPAQASSYSGARSDANAARTVFRAIPVRRVISLIGTRSARYNRRICAPVLHADHPSSSGGVKIHSTIRGQVSGGVNRFQASDRTVRSR